MVDRATHALYLRRVVLRVPGPGDARGQRGVHQDPEGRGRVHDVSFHRPLLGLAHERANREDHHREDERAGEVLRESGRLFYRGAYRAERALPSRASRREAVRAAPGLIVTVGRLAFSINAAGAFTSLTLDGHVAVDLCAALG